MWLTFLIADDSLITGPLSLKSYSTVADFMDKKTKFSFKEGATVQVIQKDPSGEWVRALGRGGLNSGAGVERSETERLCK